MSAGQRTTAWLAACFALTGTSVSLHVATAPIVGALLAPNPGLATLPVALAILGTASASLPASLLMAKLGRRAGFLLGTAIGIAGALLATMAILRGSFVLLCIGLVAIGMLNGVAQLYRFAAADEAPPDKKARAISWVLAGGVVAGFLGPQLANGAKDLLAEQFAGSYAAVVVLYLGVLAILWRLRLSPPVQQDAERPARPMSIIVRQPRFAAAVACSMTSYGVMALVMTATPLSMQTSGFTFGQAAFVIQGHVVAMFAPSFFTGRLLERYGSGRIGAAGMVANGLCVAVALHGQSLAHFWIALALLGLGWNLLYVTGSTMLTQVHRTAERGKVQGTHDLLVFATAATGSLLAGDLHHRLGWEGVHAALAPGLVLAAGLLAILGWTARRPA